MLLSSASAIFCTTNSSVANPLRSDFLTYSVKSIFAKSAILASTYSLVTSSNSSWSSGTTKPSARRAQRRSILNTSSTTLFTLLALYFFGGSTIKEFVLAIIIGVIAGAYSSIFTAGTVLSIVKEKM